jgi:hypothetical protein
MYACTHETGAGYSRGVCGQEIGHLHFATLPHCHSQIDALVHTFHAVWRIRLRSMLLTPPGGIMHDVPRP